MTGEHSVFVKCAWRLLPLTMLIYAINLLDRNNVAFAALAMNRDLGLSATTYGLGAGIVFIGFVLCQVPSALMLERLGARRWISFIMLVWGTLAGACALVQGPMGFCSLRFLLGFSEAGILPGMVFYLGLWFPRQYRARIIAVLMMGAPLVKILGGPVSVLILEMNGFAGVAGWRWLFALEALPAVLLGLLVLRHLPDGPAQATWLSMEEKRSIAIRLAQESRSEHRDFRQALHDPRVYALGLVYFCAMLGQDSLTFWMPLIVKEMGFTNLATGFVVGIPYLIGVGGTLIWSRSSDRKGERFRHIAAALLFAAVGFALASSGWAHLAVLLGLTCAIAGIAAQAGPFFSLPTTFMSGPAAAAGIAVIYSMTGVAGVIGPFLTGVIRDHTGGYTAAMTIFGVMQVVAALVILALGRMMAPRAVLLQAEAR